MSEVVGVLETLPRFLDIEGGRVRLNTPPENRLVIADIVIGQQQTAISRVSISGNADEKGMFAIDQTGKIVEKYVGRQVLMSVDRVKTRKEGEPGRPFMFATPARLEVRLRDEDVFTLLSNSLMIYPIGYPVEQLVQAHVAMMTDAFHEVERQTIAALSKQASANQKRASYERAVEKAFDVQRLADEILGHSNAMYIIRRRDNRELTKRDWLYLQRYIGYDLEHPPTPDTDRPDHYLVNLLVD